MCHYMEKSKLNNKYFATIFVSFVIGLSFGGYLSSLSLTKSMNEIDLLHKSIELTNGSRSFSLYQVLDEGNIAFVKESLLSDYQEAKKAASSINIEKISNENWPFTVDEWFIKNIESTINHINNPNPCKNHKVASTDQVSERGCNG